MYKSIRIVILLLIPFVAISKEKVPFTAKDKKGNFYFYWGYNREYFSKSNIHFSGPDYDVTFYNLTASDRPSPVNADYLNPGTVSIPQFNYRVGFFITKSIAVSLGMDHMKYVVDQNQNATMSGVVTEKISTKYAGTYLNTPVVLTDDLLRFEHTNGFNLLALEVEYLPHLFDIPQAKLAAYWNMGMGGIWLITKTDVHVFGDGMDNDFHLAGYTFTGKTGPRIEYNNLLFLAGEVKGGYASLPSVLVKNSAPERADHNLKFLEYYVVLGVNFRLFKHDIPVKKVG